ncbi:hypothetical protein N824_21340 [Pedobacter sp. V48]|nr:hypothetical protein N824_21340 [Pedobacter sp. V48]
MIRFKLSRSFYLTEGTYHLAEQLTLAPFQRLGKANQFLIN